jgi:hypothetical protein
LYSKEGNTPEIFSQMRWATNGVHLISFYRSKARFFSLETGIRVFKLDISSTDDTWMHSPASNIFYRYSEDYIQTNKIKNLAKAKGMDTASKSIELLRDRLAEKEEKSEKPDLIS